MWKTTSNGIIQDRSKWPLWTASASVLLSSLLLLTRSALAGEAIAVTTMVEIAPESSVYEIVEIDDEIFEERVSVGFGELPSVAGDSNGNFVVTWVRDDYGVAARHFGPDGMPRSEEIDIADENTIASGADVAVDSGGAFVVVWSQSDGDPIAPAYPVFGQRFTDDTNSEGHRFRVSQENSAAAQPAVATTPDDHFVVTWAEDYTEVRAKEGRGESLSGTSFVVSNEDFAYEVEVDVGVDGKGNFLAVWPDDDDGSITGRIFHTDGIPRSASLNISGTGPDDWFVYPEVVGLAQGGFIVAWERYCCSDGVGARLFSSTGQLVTELEIGPEDAEEVSIAALGSERFVAVWTTQSYDGGRVEGQLYRIDGTPEGPQFLVDGGAYGLSVAVAERGVGNFVVVWDGEVDPGGTCAGDDCGLMARLYTVLEDAREIPLAGKKLIVNNKVPDKPEKNKGQAMSERTSAVVGLPPGGPNDPRCLGAPEGTVKAWVRFSSESNLHDSGIIPLPCQYWKPFGGDPQTSFYYRDRTMAGGPCYDVKVQTDKVLSIRCKSRVKNEVTSIFGYDLEPGVGEGRIDVLFHTGPVGSVAGDPGSIDYCMSFPLDNPRYDGSDGKRALGRRALAPTSCRNTVESFANATAPQVREREAPLSRHANAGPGRLGRRLIP